MGADVQYELTRLSSENFELLGKVESLDKMNKKLKRQLKAYSKKLNAVEGTSIRFTLYKKIKSFASILPCVVITILVIFFHASKLETLARIEPIA